MAIKIKGVIGCDVIGSEFADRLSKLSGDIEFEIDSPGGSVFHGISIFNAIKNYDRGKCRMHVVGDCSSMAAYIMLAGDGPVDFEPNAIVVLHNPWSIAVGDYRAMQKEGQVLEQMASLYAKEFVKKGLFEEKEIRSIMDEETWFIGAEKLKRLGNVLDGENSDSDSQEEQSQEIQIAALREKMSEAKARLKALKTDSDELEKIAALVSRPDFKAEVINNGSKEKTKGETKMNLNELKSQNPSVYAEAKKDGVAEEQKRVASLMKFIDIDKQAVIDAIQGGKTISDDDFQASILMARIKKDEIDNMEKQNPTALNPQVEIHAPESEDAEIQQQAEAAKKAEQEKEEQALNDLLSRMHNA